MQEPIYLIYLDDYHLGDPLFLSSMARMMARLGRGVPPCLFLHGSGDQAERLLNAEGLFPEKENGVMQVSTEVEAALVERAIRQLNRRIVGGMTEEGVHAVGFQGLDRGLLRLDDTGALSAGRVAWLLELVLQGAVSVVSTLVKDLGLAYAREVNPAAALLALARSMRPEAVVVVYFTRNNQPGLVDEAGHLSQAQINAVPDTQLPEPAAMRAMVEVGYPVLLTSPVGLFGDEIPTGTKIFTSKTA